MKTSRGGSEDLLGIYSPLDYICNLLGIGIQIISPMLLNATNVGLILLSVRFPSIHVGDTKSYAFL